MKTAVHSELQSKFFCSKRRYSLPREKEISLVNTKFYQKLFVIIIASSTFLIIPESPTELETICVNYNSRSLCNVW